MEPIPNAREIINKQVNEWLEAGLVEKGVSPWVMTTCLALKKKGHITCVDARDLNKVTKVISCPIPRCDDLINLVGDTKSKWFSCLDCKSGYNQVKLSPEVKLKSAV